MGMIFLRYMMIQQNKSDAQFDAISNRVLYAGHQQSASQQKPFKKWYVVILMVFIMVVAITIFIYIQINPNHPYPSSQHQIKGTSRWMNQQQLASENRDQSQVQPGNNYCIVYDDKTDPNKKKLQTQMNQNHYFKCVNITPIFHIWEEQTFFIQTLYEIVLPYCEPNQGININKFTIHRYNQHRTIIEWALKNIQSKDKVYYQYDEINPAQIVMISQLIGPQGYLYHHYKSSSQVCYKTMLTLHGINNVQLKEIKELKQIQQYQTIILTNLTKIMPFLWNSAIFNGDKIKKILLFSKNISQVIMIKDWISAGDNSTIKKIKVNQDRCNDLIEDIHAEGQGYYQIILKQSSITINASSRQNPKPTNSSILREFQQKWTAKKTEQSNKLSQNIKRLKSQSNQCSCIDLSKLQSKNKTYSIYGTYYHDASQEQMVDWQKSRQVIEWVRANSNKRSHIYYQLYADGQNNNFYHVMEICRLIPEGKLFYAFQEEQQEQKMKKERIQRWMKAKNMNNIVFLEKRDIGKADQSTILVTDNVEIINRRKSQVDQLKVKILGFFTHKSKQSKEALGNLYMNYHIRQIMMPADHSDCISFNYRHFFVNSERPHGFYEIKPKGHVVYMYWEGQYSSLSPNRLFACHQVIDNIGVELKIINSRLLTQYLQRQELPIHKVYRLLTSVHRSDYFRPYVMYHYGGGYTDVKHVHISWLPYFQKLDQNPQMLAYGYTQIGRASIGCNEQHGPISCTIIIGQFNKLIGNGCYIHRKKSQIVQDWLLVQHEMMDRKYERFVVNPFHITNEGFGWGVDYNGSVITSKYPWRWSQNGQIFHRTQFNYLGRYFMDMAYVIYRDYRD